MESIGEILPRVIQELKDKQELHCKETLQVKENRYEKSNSRVYKRK